MAEESSSWVRRINFSHTVCHRFDSSRMASLSLRLQRDEALRLKACPNAASCSPYKESPPSTPQIERNPLTNKHRSVSPLPETFLSETFKEAQSHKKKDSQHHTLEERTWIRKVEDITVEILWTQVPLVHNLPETVL